MPSNDGHDSSLPSPSPGPFRSASPFRSLGRSFFGPRRENVQSTETNHESSYCDLELESFQKQVAERFHEVALVTNDELLSIEWIRKLLDAFIYCQEQFRVILLKNKAQISRPPLDRSVDEYFERSLKALDICKATRDGIQKIRLWQKHLEIVESALDSRKRVIGQGQLSRARKALMDLALAMLEEKDTDSVLSRRNRSFGRHNASKDRHQQSPGHSRSLSWSVSPSWSAAKQLQSIANNLVLPRVNEIVATNGLILTIFMMTSVLMFVLWTLVAAIPCQDRRLDVHLSLPYHLSWGTPLVLLHKRIVDESKKEDRKDSNGLLKEIYEIEKCARHLTDLVDLTESPLTVERKNEIEHRIRELALVCEAFKKGLDPLEQQVREVFRGIMGCRIEGLEVLGGAKGSTS